ncbi:MAG TPA: S1-like domain-containing RNA-binding protein [Modicisalibacter sp.]|nr:S1-like domain-containing RNA-binding protein [Modicisalibacter sp.]
MPRSFKERPLTRSGAPSHQGSPRSEPRPLARLGEVAYLKVVMVNDTGAFLDWGLPKDLLLPYGEQRPRPAVGKRVLVMVTEDAQGRPLASMRLDKFIADEASGLSQGDKVALIVAEPTDLGVKAVVDNRFWGLIYHDDMPQPLRRGQRLDGYVRRLRDDGRLDLALVPPGAAKLDVVGEQILAALHRNQGYLTLSDKSPADEIKARLGVSKSAFKQAIGRLYKRRLIAIEQSGIRLLPDTENR